MAAVPPLYIRQQEIGISAQGLEIKALPRNIFIILVTPVGPYFKGGI